MNLTLKCGTLYIFMLKLDKFMIGRKTMENKMLDDPNRKYVPKKNL